MAVTALRGYDPTTLARKNVPASTPEHSVPPTDIVDEGLFTVMTLRKRHQQSNAAMPSDTDRATSAKTTPRRRHRVYRGGPPLCPALLRKTSPSCSNLESRWISKLPSSQETSASLKAKIHWRGGNIAFIRKLGKTSVTLLTFEGHHVPRFVHYNSVVTPIREYKRTIPACYCCGTVGHRLKLCPHPNDPRCGHCCQVVGASEEWMTPHECKPSCLVCGEEHLTGSPACKARFRRLQQTGGQNGGRGSPQQRPKPKTSDVTPKAVIREQPTKTPRPHPPKTSQASRKTSSKTPDQGAPVFQVGEFPPLPERMSSLPNAQLLAKIATLEAGSTPSTPASPPPPLPKITVAVPEPTPMCVAPSVSETSNTEQRFQAIESAMTALVAQLTTMSKSIENLSNTVTHQWNCRGFKDRAKRANFSLYLETFEHLCAVVALQKPGNTVRLTGYNTFQRDPFTCLLVHKTLTAQEVDLDLSIPYSYTMVTVSVPCAEPTHRAHP
ncbi:hypothetical protein HPB49_026074 [Dermacentor silvarum]|nr:hypothetical protein HPB49_026074 [Dermacentor silvarum]